MKCPVCSGDVVIKLETYESNGITIPDVGVHYCPNRSCGHTWLSIEEEN